MPSWVPVIVGLVLQALMLAYFLGRMKAQQEGQRELVDAFKKFAGDAIDRLTARADAADNATTEAVKERASLASRMRSVEQSTDGLPKFREEFAGFSAATTQRLTHIESELKRVAVASEGIQRQVANLALHGPGLVVRMPDAKL